MTSKNKTKKLDKNNCSDFVALISHQLKTPLTYAKWALELSMDDEELNEKYKKQIGNVYSSIAHLILFVGDLSNFAKIESGEMVAAKQLINALDAVNDSIQMFQIIAERKNQKIIVSEQSKTALVKADPMLIGEAMKNLLDNAIKYGNENSNIEITVHPEGKECVVAIRSHGSIISKTDGNRIFSKFYRGQNAKKIVADGSGLGLFIAKSLIEANNGKIWYESKDGEGTTFYFAIPIKS